MTKEDHLAVDIDPRSQDSPIIFAEVASLIIRTPYLNLLKVEYISITDQRQSSNFSKIVYLGD